MIRIIIKTIIITVLTMLACSCGQERNVFAQTKRNNEHTVDYSVDSTDYLFFPAKRNSSYTLKKDIDLCGKTYIIPEGVTLKVRKGVIKNGTLIGQDTKIYGDQPIFDNVTIKGEWIVPIIRTFLFKNLNYDNSLRDVIALTNPSVHNTVIIDEGTYYFSIENNGGSGIIISDNTIILLNGTLVLNPNAFSNYHIIHIIGKNVSIEGNGSIYGDLDRHFGTHGEWGMGIELSGAENVSIHGVTVANCWGDCIYIGGDSENVNINSCKLNSSRRQGISVSSGKNLVISDCYISNIEGTDPQYAIDIEPNRGEKVCSVTINNVVSDNCYGGIQVWGNANDAYVKDVVIYNSSIKGSQSRYPLRIYKAEGIIVNNTEIQSDGEFAALTQYISGLTVSNCIMKASGVKPLNIIQCEATNLIDNYLIQNK